MTATRKPGRFRAHANSLGIPGEVAEYILGAISGGTPVPGMLRGAVQANTDQSLNSSGLAAQVRRLLSWDWRRFPGDYMADPREAPIPAFPGEGRAAPDRGEDTSPGAAQWYWDMLARRAWAAGACQYGHALPSYGTFYDHCGRYVVRGCLDHADGKTRSGRRGRWWCRRLSCPVCYEHSIRVAAMRCAMLLISYAVYRKSQPGAGRYHLAYHHWIVSVDPARRRQMKTQEGVDMYRKEVYKQMKWLGYTGGVVVYHPWSFKGGRKRFRPHLHCVAAGYVDRDRYLDKYGKRIMLGEMDSDPVREAHRRTGAVYREVSRPVSALETYSLLVYLLTHVGLRIPKRSPDGGQPAGPAGAGVQGAGAGLRKYGQAVSYFGNISANQFALKIILSRSRDAGRHIAKILQSVQKRVEARGWRVWAHIRPVTCPPSGAERPGGRRGGVLDVDPRTAECGGAVYVPLAEAEDLLWSLAARGGNAPLAKSTEGGRPSDGSGPEPYRYAVIRLDYDEKRGGVRVRSSNMVIGLDPSTENLCGECRGPLRVIVRADGGGIPPPDSDHPDGEGHARDDTGWTYYRPRGEHAGMGIPYYMEDDSPRWDRGIPNMPEDATKMPAGYQLFLREWVGDRTVRCMVAAMRLQDPGVHPGMARRAVRRHLARAGHPDKTRDGWEDVLLAGVWREYESMSGRGPRAGARPAGTSRGTAGAPDGVIPAPSGLVLSGRPGPARGIHATAPGMRRQAAVRPGGLRRRSIITIEWCIHHVKAATRGKAQVARRLPLPAIRRARAGRSVNCQKYGTWPPVVKKR